MFSNPVYKEIKEKARANSEWATMVVPILPPDEPDESDKDLLEFYYLEVDDEAIKQIEEDSMVIDEWT